MSALTVRDGSAEIKGMGFCFVLLFTSSFNFTMSLSTHGLWNTMCSTGLRFIPSTLLPSLWQVAVSAGLGAFDSCAVLFLEKDMKPVVLSKVT